MGLAVQTGAALPRRAIATPDAITRPAKGPTYANRVGALARQPGQMLAMTLPSLSRT